MHTSAILTYLYTMYVQCLRYLQTHVYAMYITYGVNSFFNMVEKSWPYFKNKKKEIILFTILITKIVLSSVS